jgi:hypothetical protein
VHRLGRGTSGVLLCARSQVARERLSRAFAEDAKGERRQPSLRYAGFSLRVGSCEHPMPALLGKDATKLLRESIGGRGHSAGAALELCRAATAQLIRARSKPRKLGNADEAGSLLAVRVVKPQSCFASLLCEWRLKRPLPHACRGGCGARQAHPEDLSSACVSARFMPWLSPAKTQNRFRSSAHVEASCISERTDARGAVLGCGCGGREGRAAAEVRIDAAIGAVQYEGVAGGLYMAAAGGKPSRSVARCMHYDPCSNTSIVEVRTGCCAPVLSCRAAGVPQRDVLAHTD